MSKELKETDGRTSPGAAQATRAYVTVAANSSAKCSHPAEIRNAIPETRFAATDV